MSADEAPLLSGQRTVVVGAGILGTMHAYFAWRRGAHVVHLERDVVPSGATVRNFGLIWVSGRAPGAELRLALRARDLWEDVGEDVPDVGFRPNGSITVLRNDGEYEVATRALSRADAASREFRLLTRAEVVDMNPALRGDFDAGLYCGRDAAVESRVALRALRHAMKASTTYEYHRGCEVVGIDDFGVVDHRGDRHRGDQVWLCPGASVSGVFAELFEGEPLRRVRLNMVETSRHDATLTTSLANGDSFRYYPAFRSDAEELLAAPEDIARRFAIQLLCQQRLHGGLTIGDTHESDEPGSFESRDEPMDLIVRDAWKILGGLAPIERRWTGVYHQLSDPAPDELYYRRRVASGVSALTGAGGRGMTLAPAIAEESLNGN